MQSKGYYTYYPQIYPRHLYIVIGNNKDGIVKTFGVDGKYLDEIDSDVNAMTFREVNNKVTGKLGYLVIFSSKKKMTMRVICHEAFHVLSEFMDVLPLSREPSGGNEHLAYLLDWICECINMARLGKGEFKEFESIKQK